MRTCYAAISANILLDSALRAKVSDYGITRRGPLDAGKTSTSTNVIIGTTVYMAPEYFHSGRVSDKIDAYSFGVVSQFIVTVILSVSKKSVFQPVDG